MSFRISVHCEASGVLSFCGDPGWTADELGGPVPPEFIASLAEHGWAERDGKFYCRKHDPAKQGVVVAVGLEYVEIAPGVRARWPGAVAEGDSFPIEVQVDAPNGTGR